MRVVGYARVSTREQADHGYSIGEQNSRLRAYCQAKDWTLLRVIEDPGFSGAKMQRPGLQQVLEMVRRRECDAVLVWKLDRLSRSQKDTLYLLEDVFLANGCGFVSMLENFDTSTAFGRAMVGILSVFAQLEREQFKERSAIGRVGRAKAGLFHGGGYAPIGYDYYTKEDGGQGLVVNEYEAMQVREVYRLYLAGWAVHKIQVYMHERYTTKNGCWASDTTVRSVLSSPIYLGRITWAGKTYEGQHEALISQNDFDQVAARRESLKWQPAEPRAACDLIKNSPFRSTHILGGITWCARCGARYFASGNYSGRGENRKYWPYYTCYSVAKSSKKMIKDPNCKNKRWAVGKLDAIILAEISRLEFDPAALAKAAGPVDVSGVEEKRRVLEARVAEVRPQMERLLDLCQTGGLPVASVSGRLAALQKELDALNGELSGLAVPETVDRLAVAQEMLAGASAVIKNGTPEQKRALVHSLIGRIDIDGEDITIHWLFAHEN